MENKEKYEELQMQVIPLDFVDIISTSSLRYAAGEENEYGDGFLLG